MNQQNKKNNIKIYTLSVPPTPEEPFLYLRRHREIIRNFEQEANTYFTMNSQGEVDFYVLIKEEDSFDDLADIEEQFELCVQKENSIELRILYEEATYYTFRFNLANLMDKHILDWLVKEERINIYYIKRLSEEYVCIGMATSVLPKGFVYDLVRLLRGKRPLKLPVFSEHFSCDRKLTKARLLEKGWGFYLDYTALLQKMGNVQDVEEIISRYVFDIMACVQESMCSQDEKGTLILWTGRKVGFRGKEQPIEYYNLYLSGNSVKNTKTDSIKMIVEKCLSELPEFQKVLWVSPLAEEGIPLAVISAHSVSRFNLTSKFFILSNQLFQEYYLPHCDYINCYHKLNYNRELIVLKKNKVSSLVKKRQEKGIAVGDNLSASEVMNLIEWGNEEDLPVIFQHIDSLKEEVLDEAMYILSQRYKLLLEPSLLVLLDNSSLKAKKIAMFGLGLIESKKGIPLLVEKLEGCSEEAAMAVDALLIIGNPAIPYVIPLLKSKKASVRLRVVKVLGAIGSTQAFAVLKSMEYDQSIRVEKAKNEILKKLSFYDR